MKQKLLLLTLLFSIFNAELLAKENTIKQQNATKSEDKELNLILLQLKSINFQAGKEVIDITKSKKLKDIKQVSKKEFEKVPQKKYIEKYSEGLSIISSIYLDQMIKNNAEFIALYKANQIFLNNFAYLTDNKMKEYVNMDTEKYENSPTIAKPLKVVWIETKPKTENNISSSQTNKPRISLKDVMKKKKYYGYCVFENKKEVYAKPIPAKVLCTLQNNAGDSFTAYLYGKLIPDLKNKALYFKPIFLEKENGETVPVKPLMVLTADKKSNNIANTINERLLEKVLANAGSQTLEDVRQALKEKYGKGREENVYISGDVVVQKRDNSLINIQSLAIKDFITSILEQFADITKENLQNVPTIFTVENGQTIYVELIIDL
jgi:hypothetical protein